MVSDGSVHGVLSIAGGHCRSASDGWFGGEIRIDGWVTLGLERAGGDSGDGGSGSSCSGGAEVDMEAVEDAAGHDETRSDSGAVPLARRQLA